MNVVGIGLILCECTPHHEHCRGKLGWGAMLKFRERFVIALKHGSHGALRKILSSQLKRLSSTAERFVASVYCHLFKPHVCIKHTRYRTLYFVALSRKHLELTQWRELLGLGCFSVSSNVPKSKDNIQNVMNCNCFTFKFHGTVFE